MKRFSSIAALTALLLTAAACGDDASSSSDTAAADTTSPATTVPDTTPDTTSDTTPITIADDVPQAIVSLSPTATEMLFAIGAGDQVIAVDDYSNYPAEALEKPHELSAYEPSIEAIAALEPDLVVASSDIVQAPLEALGIAVWVGPAAESFDDVYAQIEQLGAATGHIAEAAELVGQMQADIAAAVAAVPETETALSYFHELDSTFYSVTSDTFIGQVYGLFGLVNIADGVEEGNQYPQLSAEHIISSAPDLIFLADTKCCGENADTVAARPGWNAIPAVANGGVVEMDDDIASRWGPRIVDYIQAVADALNKVSVGA
ncbi:MAG: ABC transporter substrate-binding protein [Actinomycetota bacterium]|nr:ABC transporter substrate-binding protein [Actinomycetota bacterium]